MSEMVVVIILDNCTGIFDVLKADIDVGYRTQNVEVGGDFYICNWEFTCQRHITVSAMQYCRNTDANTADA